MVNSTKEKITHFEACGLINSLCMPGPEQMALDVLLLEKSLKEKTPIPKLRFYYWRDSWLSIGKNQSVIPPQWKDLVQEEKLKIVRRPSGGGAVLHSGGLTYAMIWPGAPRKRRLAYAMCCEWLIKGFRKLGIPLRLGDEIGLAGCTNCFSRATSADLIDDQGYKRVGSAQLWRSGNLLQHGEIILDPPPQLWMEVFGEPAPRKTHKTIPKSELEALLKEAWIKFWPNTKSREIIISEREIEEISQTASGYCLTQTN